MKKRNGIALAGLLSVAAIGGTMAYFNQTLSVENNFDTGKYGSTLEEEFRPTDGKDWQPGVEVPKVAQIKNTGDVDLVVRMKLEEKWTRGDAILKELSSAERGDSGVYMDKIKETSQENAVDGLVAKDGSVVTKTLDLEDWVYNEADGYYYYKKVLAPEKEGDAATQSATNEFLKAVRLLPEADMGDYKETKYYTLKENPGEEDWIAIPENKTEKDILENLNDGEMIYHLKSVIGSENPGYAGAEYSLKIIANTAQATDKAVSEVFKIADAGDNDGFLRTLGWNLKKEIGEVVE